MFAKRLLGALGALSLVSLVVGAAAADDKSPLFPRTNDTVQAEANNDHYCSVYCPCKPSTSVSTYTTTVTACGKNCGGGGGGGYGQT
jgi:hypothetical protein